MFEAQDTRSILHVRVHSDTGGTELEGIRWDVSVSPEADGDFHLSVPLADRAGASAVLRHLIGLHLDLVTVHMHPVLDPAQESLATSDLPSALSRVGDRDIPPPETSS
jgi:hypothetical protein